MRPRAAATRGFTLVELLVALAATGVLVAGAMTLVIQQQRAYQAGAQDRALEETGRIALGEVTTQLREAGFGVDTQLVFDFGAIDGVELSAVPAGVTGVRAGSYACEDRGLSAVDCRDRVDGPDELVFLTRNSRFSRPVSAVSTSAITLTGDLRTPLLRGQLLQVMCLTGNQIRAYVTVSTQVEPAATWSATASVTVPIVTGGADFPHQTDFFSDPCFLSETVAVKVDRFRYHVATYDDAGDELAWGDERGRPWLMLDTGTFQTAAGVERRVEIPVSPDVEDLQVVYLFPPSDPAEVNRLVGDQEGTPASGGPFPITVAERPPRNEAPPDDPSRLTGSPGNIQAVRVAIVVRSGDADITYADEEWRRLPAAGNRAEVRGPPNHRRQLYEATVVVYNMQSRYLAYPMVNPAGGRGLNVGGG